MSSDKGKEHEVFMIQCRTGLSHDQALAQWEFEHAPKPQAPQPEPEVQEVEPEETEPEDLVPTRAEIIKDVQEAAIREKKLELLDRIEESLERDEENDLKEEETRKAILETQRQSVEKQNQLSGFWLNVLGNSKWEGILREYFLMLHGMVQGMCAKTTLTVEIKDGKMHLTGEFFDSKGKPVTTQFNEVYGDEA